MYEHDLREMPTSDLVKVADDPKVLFCYRLQADKVLAERFGPLPDNQYPSL